MGIPSTFEDIEERKSDARFADRESAPDLKALKSARVIKNAGKPKSPNVVDRLSREVRRQAKEIAKLKKALGAAEEVAASERAHLRQIKSRSNKNSNLLLEAENKRLQAELANKIRELEETRKLAMKNLFGKGS